MYSEEITIKIKKVDEMEMFGKVYYIFKIENFEDLDEKTKDVIESADCFKDFKGSIQFRTKNVRVDNYTNNIDGFYCRCKIKEYKGKKFVADILNPEMRHAFDN